MRKYPYKVELLAPAGSREALVGAFSAGADAVYLGGERFGARAYADNFSTQEIIRAIRQAHVLGRRVYLTANVLTRENEMAELTAFVRELADAGLDGAIVQDTGVLSALHEICPELPLHASTQLSVTSSESADYLQRHYGITRVVPARELSMDEIRTLHQEAPEMEIEAFIHGAMCYSYSGRCLMSSFLGGRSGNRGRCAGTCRLPYRVLGEDQKPVGPDARKKEVYPLSMKDMCVLPILPELIDAGVHSFKIEGRMKKPVYAAGVTAVYRKYIDRCYAWMDAGRPTPWKIEEEDLERLRALYIRTDLGTGYYHARNGRNLVTIGKSGYAGTDSALEEEISRQYLEGLPRRQITGKGVFRIGQPAQLEVFLEDPFLSEKPFSTEKPYSSENPFSTEDSYSTENPYSKEDPFSSKKPFSSEHETGLTENASPENTLSAKVFGAVVQTASGRPMDPAELSERLRRTGDSLFTFSSLELETDQNIFLPVSAVNALRREALQLLEDRILQEHGACRAKKQPDPDQQRDQENRTEPDNHRDKENCTEPDKTRHQHNQPGVSGHTESRTKATAAVPASGRNIPELWALVSNRAQMEAAAREHCDYILLDGPADLLPPKDNFKAATADLLPPKDNFKAATAGLLPPKDGKSPVSTDIIIVSNGKKDIFATRKTQMGHNSPVKSEKIRYICVLPPVFRVIDREEISRQIEKAQENGFSGILVRTLEELELVRQLGYPGEIIADASLYSWNGRALTALAEDCSRIVCSLELNQGQIREAVNAATDKSNQRLVCGTEHTTPGDMMSRMILPVYGRIPMMESAGCVRSTQRMCIGRDGFWYLEDRMGKHLPVRCRCKYCSNTIYNAVPLSLHQFAGRGLYREMPARLCMFTTETQEETRQILQFFRAIEKVGSHHTGAHLAGSTKKESGKNDSGKKEFDKNGAAGKRAAGNNLSRKPAAPPFSEYTNGHYKTGAE